ncbi:hypothetical protein RG959_13190 [Domibacillus sp. 8LH]|nr:MULTISPECIES: hypothetical protein [Domibacillus]MCI2254029.1 hypothetical protein [Domibacillus sp. PGB-M46]MCM3789488.1 hypothetical protein [Domibacillus indicus]WNS79323.1 hypothetical protein RRU94_17400 [Domibacillus sp. DTU_2020_1001157_1_SI_ALB_TIR_016]
MEMYREAYEYYLEMCKAFGIKKIPFYRFMHNLTEEQMKLYIQKAQ